MAHERAGGLCCSWAGARPGWQSPPFPLRMSPGARGEWRAPALSRDPRAISRLAAVSSRHMCHLHTYQFTCRINSQQWECWAKGDMPLQFSKNYQIHTPISVNDSIRLPLACNEKSFLCCSLFSAEKALASWRSLSSASCLSMLSGPLTHEGPPLSVPCSPTTHSVAGVTGQEEQDPADPRTYPPPWAHPVARQVHPRVRLSRPESVLL